MNFQDIIRKLTSRKLWLAVAGAATGVAMALGANSSEIQSVAGAVTSMVSIVTYIITEGHVDAARVEQAVNATQNAVDTIKK